jgi:hypothetical protein
MSDGNGYWNVLEDYQFVVQWLYTILTMYERKKTNKTLSGKTWPTLRILGYLWASWVVLGPQLCNGCLNMDVNIDYGTMTPRVANWLPKAIGMIIFFLGGNQWP